MRILQKIVSVVLVGALLGSSSVSFALTNKESTLASIDALNASITNSIALKEKTLSDRANELGNRYDTTIRSLGFQSDEVEALTSIKTLGVPSFRQDIAQAYLGLKQSMLQDIKTSQTSLASLHDEVALGYADLSSAQKQSYDAKLAGIQNNYAVFLSGSSTSIDAFTNTFSGRILSDTALVTKMMRDNGKYIAFIRDIRSGYARIDEKKMDLLAKKEVLDTTVLPKVQGGFLVLTANKKIFTDAIRKDLTSGLEKAMTQQERIRKREVELRAHIEDIMNKWNEYLVKNFGQDDELIDATKDLDNVITLEKSLHSRVYDVDGKIRSLDMSGSTLLGDIAKTDSSLANSVTVLTSLIASYSTGNTLASLNDQLNASYKTELATYRADFTKLLQEKLNTSLLEEKNHAQTLSLLDQEEKILKQNLETTASADFAGKLVSAFNTKITGLAKADGGADTMKKAQMLGYRYARMVAQKKIADQSFVPYYGMRNSLDTTLSNLFVSLENKAGKDGLLVKFPTVSAKIDTLLAGTKLSVKNRYTLLVVQSNILKYLEDATK